MTPSTADNTVLIASAADIPAEWGAPRFATRKGTVARREPNGVESFALNGGALTAHPGTDWVIVQGSGEEYPIRRDVFARSYEEIAPGRYRKTAASRLVQVPRGVLARLATKEGELDVRHPDYVVIGIDGEVYSNSLDWVAENLNLDA